MSCDGPQEPSRSCLRESPVSVRVERGLSGFLSSRDRGIRPHLGVEAETSGFLSSADMISVLMEFQQGSCASLLCGDLNFWFPLGVKRVSGFLSN